MRLISVKTQRVKIRIEPLFITLPSLTAAKMSCCTALHSQRSGRLSFLWEGYPFLPNSPARERPVFWEIQALFRQMRSPFLESLVGGLDEQTFLSLLPFR